MNVEEARKKISSYIQKTPLIRAPDLEKANVRIFLKCENLQFTGSFKQRGAFNALLHLSGEEKKRGVITRSSGNFAQALAYAAYKLGIEATIVMSESASEYKKEKTKKYGPKLYFRKTRQEEDQTVREMAEEKKLVRLSPFNHKDVIAGGGTLGLEILEDLPTISHYFCPLGGGGLMGGSSFALKENHPEVQTIGIEPEGANDYYRTLKEKKRVVIMEPDTIADGLRAPCVGDLDLPLLQKYVDRVEIVSDDAIKKAMRFLYRKMGLIIEPSGAASVAGLLSHTEALSGDVVCVLSGGNVVYDSFIKWANG